MSKDVVVKDCYYNCYVNTTYILFIYKGFKFSKYIVYK